MCLTWSWGTSGCDYWPTGFGLYHFRNSRNIFIPQQGVPPPISFFPLKFIYSNVSPQFIYSPEVRIPTAHSAPNTRSKHGCIILPRLRRNAILPLWKQRFRPPSSLRVGVYFRGGIALRWFTAPSAWWTVEDERKTDLKTVISRREIRSWRGRPKITIVGQE